MVPPVRLSYLSDKDIKNKKLTLLRNQWRIIPDLEDVGLLNRMVCFVEQAIGSECHNFFQSSVSVCRFIHIHC